MVRRRMAFAGLACPLALLLIASCTQDFGAFKVEPLGAGTGGSSSVDGGGATSDAGATGNGGSNVGGVAGSGGATAAGGTDAGTIDGSSGKDGGPIDGSAGAGGAAPDSGAGGGAATGGAVAGDAAAGGTGAGGVAVGGADAGDAAAGGAGAGGAGAGGTAAGGAGAGGGSCLVTEKLCGTTCTSLTDPTKGCDDPACAPCSLPHVSQATCTGGQCAPSTCAAGFGACNSDPADGCERAITGDVVNCGACDRTCAAANVASLECTDAACTSSCDPGFANCVRPPATGTGSGPDEGCETDVRTDRANCGGCLNACTNPLVCLSGHCGCNVDSQCKGPASQSATCDLATGICHCSATATCVQGETCSQGLCKCNFGTPCTTGQTCCAIPKGCFDLQTDTASCGACGHACPPGFTCIGGDCACNGDADCNAGSAGTCDPGSADGSIPGLCVCGATTCARGQRCQANGQCG